MPRGINKKSKEIQFYQHTFQKKHFNHPVETRTLNYYNSVIKCPKV